MSVELNIAARNSFHVYWTAGALFISIAAIGFVPQLVLGERLDAAPLLAPMGASALMMLSMPKSGLARPWTVLAANAAATIIGLLIPHLIPSIVFASATAMAITVATMGALRIIHPPSVGLTLFAASRGALPFSQSVHFLASEVMFVTILLVIVAIALNRIGKIIFAVSATKGEE